jgi:dolichyl-phosphate beta-glucosyltransferase
MTDLSVIIPTFNAGARAHATVAELHARLSGTGYRVEIVLVDDGSRLDQRPDPALLPAEARFLQLDRNRGKGYAVRAGLLAATGQCRIFTDVDLPYGADALLECFDVLRAGGVDFVYGDRSLPESKRFSRLRKRRRLSSVVFRAAVLTIAGLRQADTQCGIKGLRADAAAAILPLMRTDGFAFDVEIFRCARDSGLVVQPMSVHLVNADDSTVRLFRDSTAMLRDLVAIRMRSIRGKYRIVTPLAQQASQRRSIAQ